MNIQDILNSESIVAELDREKKADIVSKVISQYELDVQSRSTSEETLKEIMKLALSIAEPKATPWEGASNVIHPLTATAAIEFGAKCTPEILNDGFIVKPKVYGKDEGQVAINRAGEEMIDPATNKPLRQNVGAKYEKGMRVATYMNWQLSQEIDNWEEDTDRLFISLAITGDMFRKIYEDALEEKIAAPIIYPDKLVVNNGAISLEKAPATHIIELYDHEIQERIRGGYYEEFVYSDCDSDAIADKLDLSQVSTPGNAANAVNNNLHIFLEQHTWYDLDEDGLAEPYVITIHKASNSLVRITPRFKESDIKYAKTSKGEKGKKIIRIKAKNYFVKYSFIPSPDGAFYSIGLGHLLFNINKSLNTAINQLFDAGTLANTGGGFIAKSLKISGGPIKFRPSEWKMVDAFGSSIRDAIVPLPTPEPSQTLFALLGFLAQAGKELGSLRDVLSGEQAGNVQATTMMALVEQGVKQFKAVYKRIYASMNKEFKMIFDINADTVTDKQYSKVLDTDPGEVDVKDDFDSDSFSIVPVADVDRIMNIQRMAQANFLMSFLGNPNIDQEQLLKEIFEAYNVRNRDKLIVTPEPQPDPNMLFAQAEVQKAQTKASELEVKVAEAQTNIEKAKYDIEEKIAKIEKINSETIRNIAESMATKQETQLRPILEYVKQIREGIMLKAEVENKKADAEAKQAKSEEEKPRKEITNGKEKETDVE